MKVCPLYSMVCICMPFKAAFMPLCASLCSCMPLYAPFMPLCVPVFPCMLMYAPVGPCMPLDDPFCPMHSPLYPFIPLCAYVWSLYAPCLTMYAPCVPPVCPQGAYMWPSIVFTFNDTLDGLLTALWFSPKIFRHPLAIMRKRNKVHLKSSDHLFKFIITQSN